MNDLILQQERRDGKVRTIRPMDRVEWCFTIAACLTFEIVPVMLAVQAWISYGVLAGLCACLLPLAVLVWEVKIVVARERTGV